MFNRVIVEAGQYVADTDFLRFGEFPQAGIDRLTNELLVSGRMYKGFVVTQDGNTGIQISAGTIYDAGRMCVGAELSMSVAAHVPFTAGQQVIVTLIGQYRELAGYSETRNNEVEVATPGGGTTTQIVPSQKNRVMVRDAVLALIPGAESPNPVAPPIPAPGVPLADIRIGTGGILEIVRRTEYEAPELDALALAHTAMRSDIGLINQAIAGIRTDLAAIWQQLRSGASHLVFQQLVEDVSQIKDRLMIPDTGAPYGADWFLTQDETWVGHVDQHCVVGEGVRFPLENEWRGPIALQNPNDPNLRHANQGYICPKYTPVTGIEISQATGEMELGGTTYQTMEVRQLTMSRQQVAYGDWFTMCENSREWKSGKYDPIAGILKIGNETYEVGEVVGNAGRRGHQIYRIRKYWTTIVEVPYDDYYPVEHTIQGVIKSQTFTMSQGRYIPRVRLGIKRWGAGAQITAVLCECRADGTPDPRRILDKVTVGAAEFKAWPEWTLFPLTLPSWCQPGMYGVMFATTGSVVCATADGQGFLGGTLFDSTDGLWMRGDLTKDLCIAVDFARFDIVSMPVLLAGLTLNGGIHNYRNTIAAIVPENADLKWQLQLPNGEWTTIEAPEDDDTMFGVGNQPYYPHRVLLNGNIWEMPVLDMAQSEVVVFRADTDFRHVSAVYEMPAGVVAEAVIVSAVVEDWDEARHTIAMRLRHGAGHNTLKTHDAVTSRPVLNRPTAREFTWTFEFAPGAGVPSFAFDAIGTTDNARLTYHIENRFHTTETAAAA